MNYLLVCTKKWRRVGFSVALVMLWQAVLAQPAAPLNFCGGVSELNAFDMNWEMPPAADPNLVYEVFKDAGGGFNVIAVVNPATNTAFADFGLDATQQACYYVRSNLNGVPSASTTDTLCSIVLNVQALSPSVAQLSWNAPKDPMPGEGNFAVICSKDGDPEETIAILPVDVFAYTDTVQAVCDEAPVTYRVAWIRDFCESSSQRKTDDFRDLVPPPQPTIETASVDPLTGDIALYWAPVQAADLSFYRIQDIDLANQQFVNVGLVQAGQPTEFVYENAGLNGVKTLAVISFDVCGNDASFGGTASTMFAEADFTECNLEAMVYWTQYMGWDEGVQGYDIMAYIDGEGPELMASASAIESQAVVEVEPNREYCFYVEARSNGSQRNSTSNAACVTTDYPNIASSVYLKHVSVVNNNAIEVALVQDPQAVGTTYDLYRSRRSGNFVKLASFAQVNAPLLTYVDTDVDVRSTTYRYRWIAFDGCDALIDTSNIGTNIVLDALAETRELKNFLTWTAYEEWENGVERYEVWRKLGSQDNFTLFATLPGDQLIFEDDVEAFRQEEGEFCYKVVAVEAQPPVAEAGRAESYADCVTQPPIMWIPSAINLSGQPANQIFKPVSGFIDLETFQMEIYNKWGLRLFSSANVDDGWDGTYKGNRVREDFYRYIITYSDGSGRPYVEQDVLYVIH